MTPRLRSLRAEYLSPEGQEKSASFPTPHTAIQTDITNVSLPFDNGKTNVRLFVNNPFDDQPAARHITGAKLVVDGGQTCA